MLLAEYDYATDIAVQRQEAMLAGEARGRLETAKNLLKIGLDKLQIAQATGLSLKEIETL